MNHTFPLYQNDGIALEKLTHFQYQALQKLISAIENGDLRLVKNNCLCRNKYPENDTIIALKDRYGIPVSNILCSKCGLIRSREIFDKESNILFYSNFYRDLYVGQHQPDESFFNDQAVRGKQIYSFLKSQGVIKEIEDVVEIGCGAGGILYPFHMDNKNCRGFDFNADYLNLGLKFGLNLTYGDYNSKITDNSVDLFILSHVMEHFTEPVKEMQDIIRKIHFGKYLFVVVPGVFNIHKVYGNPLLYFQNAHVFNFNYDYLKVFFETLGLEVVYGDEYCTFLLRKQENWKEKEVLSIYTEEMGNYPQKIKQYLLKTYFRSSIIKKIAGFLDFLGLKEFIKGLAK